MLEKEKIAKDLTKFKNFFLKILERKKIGNNFTKMDYYNTEAIKKDIAGLMKKGFITSYVKTDEGPYYQNMVKVCGFRNVTAYKTVGDKVEELIDKNDIDGLLNIGSIISRCDKKNIDISLERDIKEKINNNFDINKVFNESFDDLFVKQKEYISNHPYKKTGKNKKFKHRQRTVNSYDELGDEYNRLQHIYSISGRNQTKFNFKEYVNFRINRIKGLISNDIEDAKNEYKTLTTLFDAMYTNHHTTYYDYSVTEDLNKEMESLLPSLLGNLKKQNIKYDDLIESLSYVPSSVESYIPKYIKKFITDGTGDIRPSWE